MVSPYQIFFYVIGQHKYWNLLTGFNLPNYYGASLRPSCVSPLRARLYWHLHCRLTLLVSLVALLWYLLWGFSSNLDSIHSDAHSEQSSISPICWEYLLHVMAKSRHSSFQTFSDLKILIYLHLIYLCIFKLGIVPLTFFHVILPSLFTNHGKTFWP